MVMSYFFSVTFVTVIFSHSFFFFYFLCNVKMSDMQNPIRDRYFLFMPPLYILVNPEENDLTLNNDLMNK